MEESRRDVCLYSKGIHGLRGVQRDAAACLCHPAVAAVCAVCLHVQNSSNTGDLLL